MWFPEISLFFFFFKSVRLKTRRGITTLLAVASRARNQRRPQHLGKGVVKAKPYDSAATQSHARKSVSNEGGSRNRRISRKTHGNVKRRLRIAATGCSYFGGKRKNEIILIIIITTRQRTKREKRGDLPDSRSHRNSPRVRPFRVKATRKTISLSAREVYNFITIERKERKITYTGVYNDIFSLVVFIINTVSLLLCTLVHCCCRHTKIKVISTFDRRVCIQNENKTYCSFSDTRNDRFHRCSYHRQKRVSTNAILNFFYYYGGGKRLAKSDNSLDCNLI